MKRIIVAIAAVAAILLVLFVPIPRGTLEDGETRDYIALTYRIVVWNRLIAEANQDGSAGEVHTFHKTSVFWFPDNFRHIDELWKIECAENDKILENEISRMTYVWEKEGFGGDFTDDT